MKSTNSLTSGLRSSDSRNDPNSLPIYNLKAVVQETGLKPDTLRAWERRYGMPEPERTESGHRLYSQHDIDTIKWLSARLDEGLTISRAVALWQELSSRGQNLLEAAAAQPSQEDIATTIWSPPSSPTQLPPDSISAYGDRVQPPGNQAVELRQAWMTACLTFNEQAAEQALNQAFSILSPETVCIQILQRGLAELGEGWSQGRVTVQQEHFASALAMRRLQSLISSTPPPTRAGSILIACPPQEEHVFAPLLLTALLRRKSRHVIYLGANVPIQNLETTVAQARPTLIILVAQQIDTAATLLEMSIALASRNLAVAFGGRIFVNEPTIRACIPGYYLGPSVEDALEVVEQIMASPRPRQAEQAPSPQRTIALHHFRERRASIEAHVWDKLLTLGPSQATISAANNLMGQTIIAALSLCGSAQLETSIEWMEEYLVNHHQIPYPLIELFLDAYLDAAEANLAPEGEIIAHWLRTINERDHHRPE